jgi:hypothetical protein
MPASITAALRLIGSDRTDEAKMSDKDEPGRAVLEYLMWQVVKIIALLGGLLIIAHEVAKLRGA